MKYLLWVFLSFFLLSSGLLAEQSSSQFIDAQKRKLAIYKKSAEMHRDNKTYTKAIEAYLKSIKIYKNLAKKEPKNNEWNIALLQNYNHLAIMYEKNGEKNKATAARKKADNTSETIKNHRGGNPVIDLNAYAHSEAAMMGALIGAYKKTSQEAGEQAELRLAEDKNRQATDEAIQKQLKRLKQSEAFTKLDSGHNVWLWHRQLAKESKELADMYKTRYREADHANKAIHHYKKSRNTYRYLVSKGNDPDWRNKFVHSHCVLGDMYRLMGKSDEALKYYQTALKMMKKLQNEFPKKEFISGTMEVAYGGLNGKNSMHFAEIYRKIDFIHKENNKGDTKTLFD